MKAPAFAYAGATSVANALDLLAVPGEGEVLIVAALSRHADLPKSSDVVKFGPLLGAAVINALKDAIRPFRITMTEIPMIPQVILTTLARI